MEKEERYLSIFLAKRVDGIILVTTAQTAGEMCIRDSHHGH